MNDFVLYPSILSSEIVIAQQQLDFAASHEEISTVQWDVIDGIFVENITITPADAHELDFQQLKVDLHLLTNEPIDFVHEAISAQKYLPIRAVLGQIERMSSQQHFVDEVKQQDWKVGLSLDIYTPVDEIEDHSWEMIDVVQLMAIEAGFQGQPFRPLVFEKITATLEKIEAQDHPIELVIDGAMNAESIPQVIKAGANSVVVGSALWESDDPTKTLFTLLNLDQE